MKKLNGVISYLLVFSLSFSVFSQTWCNSWHYNQDNNPDRITERLLQAGFVQGEYDVPDSEQKISISFLNRENAKATIVFFHSFFPETKESFAPFLKTAPQNCNLAFVDTRISRNANIPWTDEYQDIICSLMHISQRTNGLPIILYGCRTGAFFAATTLAKIAEHNPEAIGNANIKGMILDSMFVSAEQINRAKNIIYERQQELGTGDEQEEIHLEQAPNNNQQQRDGLTDIFRSIGKGIKTFLASYDTVKNFVAEFLKKIPVAGKIFEHMEQEKLCTFCIINMVISWLPKWIQNVVGKIQLFTIVIDVLKAILGNNYLQDNQEIHLRDEVEKLACLPLLIIHAKDDPITPLENLTELAQKIPHAQTWLIDEGHVNDQQLHPHLNHELEDGYRNALQQFLNVTLANSYAPPLGHTTPRYSKYDKNYPSLPYKSPMEIPNKEKENKNFKVGQKKNHSTNPKTKNHSGSYLNSSPTRRNNRHSPHHLEASNNDNAHHENPTVYPHNTDRSHNFSSAPTWSREYEPHQKGKSKNKEKFVTSYDLANSELYLYEDPCMKDRPDLPKSRNLRNYLG